MREKKKERKAKQFEAYNMVVSEYETALLRYAVRIVCDYNAAQDVVQDTFIKLFKRWKDEFEPSPRISSWLYRVAHNQAVDYLRKESRRRLLHTSHSGEQMKFAPANRGEGFRISEQAERAAGALQKLDLRERQLVVLKVYEEKTYREISDITGLTVSNVGYILHHAMKKMGEELKKARAI